MAEWDIMKLKKSYLQATILWWCHFLHKSDQISLYVCDIQSVYISTWLYICYKTYTNTVLKQIKSSKFRTVILLFALGKYLTAYHKILHNQTTFHFCKNRNWWKDSQKLLCPQLKLKEVRSVTGLSLRKRGDNAGSRGVQLFPKYCAGNEEYLRVSYQTQIV